MKVTLKIYASLRVYTEGRGTFELNLPQGSEISHLLDRVKIPKEEVKNIMVNGRRSTMDKPLNEGDRVAVFPAIAGG